MRPRFLVCLFILPLALPAQNAFLDLYHPFHKSLVSLRTDSLFIRTLDPYAGTVERAISYRYSDDKNLLADYQEIRKTSKNLQLWRVAQRAHWEGAFKVVETETLDSVTMKTIKERAFLAANGEGRLDSAWYEVWDSAIWRPVQKTVFTYKNDQLLERRTEMRWNAAAETWVAEWDYTLSYDNNKRLIQRKYETWADTGWVLQNLYRYDYRQGEDQPASAVWRSDQSGKLTPIDSTVAWYDGEHTQDSSIVFFWNPAASIWHQVSRQVLKDDEQKVAGHGQTYFSDGQGNWREKEETAYTTGDQVFTNEPKEELVRMFDPNTGEWKDKQKKTVAYQPLDSAHIYGSIQISEVSNSTQSWEEVFFAEAWFSIEQKTDLDSLRERASRFTFSYACGLPNPYIRNMTLSFPPSDATGNYELKIISEEGRLVYRQKYDDSGTGFVDAPLQPGFYMATVSRGNTPLCTQKLIVQQ